MARGKYSPTVVDAYRRNQNWFESYSQGQVYDPDGYDRYGYDRKDVDRAGNNEFDYLYNDGDFDSDEDINFLYEDALAEWGFDGIKPVRVDVA